MNTTEDYVRSFIWNPTSIGNLAYLALHSPTDTQKNCYNRNKNMCIYNKMVLYYKDLDLSHKISDWFIPLLLLMIVSLPVIIYMKKYNLALMLACIIAVIQIYALIMNFYKYPL